LIDEVAAAIAPVGLDQARFGELRNTANKLRAIRAVMALSSPDHERMRAIGRSRDCLFHCAPIARGGDHSADPRRRGIAEQLTPGADELRDLCDFYDRIAADLLRACAVHLRRQRPASQRTPSPRRRPDPMSLSSLEGVARG
jgi:hypothetical protein